MESMDREETHDAEHEHLASRQIITFPHGQMTIVQQRVGPPGGFVHLRYVSRAFEWLHLRLLFQYSLEATGQAEASQLFEDVMLGWIHLPSIASSLYRPAAVFCEFYIEGIGNEEDTCICQNNRFTPFCDPLTDCDSTEFIGGNRAHVRTTNINFFVDHKLRNSVACGLNHIPLQPTIFSEVLQELKEAWTKIAVLCYLDTEEEEVGRQCLVREALRLLRQGSKRKRHGRKYTSATWSDRARDEVNFLHQHFYFAGLDKAANNLSIICIHHICFQALQRLQGKDFLPCAQESEEVVENIDAQLRSLFPEIEFKTASLPYLMATFKLHKMKYRWITNAAGCIFSCPTSIITQALVTIMPTLKAWAKNKADHILSFFGVKTSLMWVIDSSFEFALDLPERLHNLFIADITRCYESIPLLGADNLPDALEYVIRCAFKFHNAQKTNADSLWIRINTAMGKADKGQWQNKAPSGANWISFDLERLIKVQKWLINSCFIRLGNHVWQQVQGIPMGFACSPLWCNMYFMAYEFQFIQRVARLQQHVMLGWFQHAYRYIDDLCVLNNPNIRLFLNPAANRSDDNPFWIYPLDIVEIQPEMECLNPDMPDLGTHGHFLNMQLEVLDFTTGVFQTTKFDKRRSLPFKFQQYIQFASNRPIMQAYNVVISQVLPVLYMASSAQLASTEILTIISTLQANGFRVSRLYRLVLRFCRGGQFPGVRFKIEDICKLLEEHF